MTEKEEPDAATSGASEDREVGNFDSEATAHPRAAQLRSGGRAMVSMKTKLRRKRGQKAYGPPFVQLHKFMLATSAWLHLSCIARSAYIQIAVRYDGINNGSLAVGVRTLAGELGCSKATAARALIELEDAGFIETTKLASFQVKDRKACEYRLTMYRCDISGHPPSKRFMNGTRQSHHRGTTVSPERQHRSKKPRQSQERDRQAPKPPPDSLMGETLVDSTREVEERVRDQKCGQCQPEHIQVRDKDGVYHSTRDIRSLAGLELAFPKER
jgi:hypothetical protein